MTSSNGIGAAASNAGPVTSAIRPTFDMTAVTAFWMSGSARLMRSSEVFMRGMTAVARLEAELGQQFLQRGMIAMQTTALETKPDQAARGQFDPALLDVGGLITTMRKITEEFQQTISDSTQALLDVSTPAQQQSVAASIHIGDPIVRRGQASVGTAEIAAE